MSTRFSSLSLRYKIPIAFAVAIVATAIVISGALSLYTYRQMRDDLFSNAAGISKTLARGLVPLMQRDEVWQAFETIVTPFGSPGAGGTPSQLVVVLDDKKRVFVSTQPTAFPLQQVLTDLDANYRPVIDRMDVEKTSTWYEETGALAGHVFAATPILADDGLALGTVIVRFADSLFLERFNEAKKRVAVATLVVVLCLVPLTWWFSTRLTEPLIALRHRMAALPSSGLIAGSGGSARSRSDEIAELSVQFDEMQRQLRVGEALKAQMATADRLAAIGRLTAGIAHEINNPLGGMLNALSTFERFGNADPLAVKTTSLLKRGLEQIKETVGALLVEAKNESRALAPEDLDDIRTLVEADHLNRNVALDWQCAVSESLPLPATPVRQLLLNLLLNARAASDVDRSVLCEVHHDDAALRIRVSNHGKPLSEARVARLFEPYPEQDSGGNGLGLWVCYQVVQQLAGKIEASSAGGQTEFRVTLPLANDAMNRAGLDEAIACASA